MTPTAPTRCLLPTALLAMLALGVPSPGAAWFARSLAPPVVPAPGPDERDADLPPTAGATAEPPEYEEDEAPARDEPPPGGWPDAGNPEDAVDTAADRLLAPTAAVRSPGTDTNLCMSWEMDLTSDPNRAQRVALIQGSTLGVSTDGGDNFTFVSVAASLPAGFSSVGDGTAAYDSAGRLFVAILGNPPTGGWQVFVSQHDPTTGALVSGPVSVSAQVGLSPSMGSDKPWIAADPRPASPFTDRLYVVWSVTGGAVSGDFEVWGAYSSDQGGSWSQMTRNAVNFGPISPNDAADGRCWPAHVAVGLAGDVYVSYHAQPGFITVPGVSGGTPDGVSGKVVVLRSLDGGATFPQRSEPFPAGQGDTTWNSQSRPGAIPDARFWTIGTGQGWLLPDPDDPCTLHVVTTDDPDNDPTVGDAADIVMATSTDCAVDWNTPQTVSDGPGGSWQLLPTAAIDPETGAIAVTWLDNRDAASYAAGSAGNARADVRVRYSLDSGLNWLPSLIVNDVPVDPDASTSTIGSGTPPTYRIGEYWGVTFAECSAHMAWAGQATCNGTMDTYYDRDPEVGDLTPPDITCPDDVVLGCTDSTDPDVLGRATARDQCDIDPSVIFVDDELGGSCPPSTVISNIDRIWSTTDAAGNFSSCTQSISIVDFDAPVISVPPPLIMECNALGGVPAGDPQIQGWLGEAGAQDACSDSDFGISGVPAFLPVGCAGEQTWVTFSASDECGNSGFEVATVAVVDTTPPTLVTPPAARFECTQPGGTPSTDPEVAAWLATAVAGDVCSVPIVTHDAPALLPASCLPGAATQVNFTATDGCGNQTVTAAGATVIDSLGPDVLGDLEQVVLGPPDHGYHCFDDVQVGHDVVDACGGERIAVAVTCTSSQCDDAPCAEHPGEDGDGDTVDDCTYDAMLDRVCARAERAETAPEGRVYSVAVTATDGCGNANTETILELFVPLGCPEGDGACIFSDGVESGNTLAWTASTG